MDARRTIDEVLTFQIPIDSVKTYKTDIFWKDILNIKGLQETDKIIDLHWKEEKESGFGSLAYEDELETYMIPEISISRKRQETDEEYLKRNREEADRIKRIEEKEKLEYLRLKAKFE